MVPPPESTGDSGASIVEADATEAQAEPKRGWLARTPLRVKLVAVMLALVSLALMVIGSASAFALRSYLVGRVDGQLRSQLARYGAVAQEIPCRDTPISIPSDYLVAISRPECTGIGLAYDRNTYKADQLPKLPENAQQAQQLDEPYTAASTDRSHRWRLMTTQLPAGEVLAVGRRSGRCGQCVGPTRRGEPAGRRPGVGDRGARPASG